MTVPPGYKVVTPPGYEVYYSICGPGTDTQIATQGKIEGATTEFVCTDKNGEAPEDGITDSKHTYAILEPTQIEYMEHCSAVAVPGSGVTEDGEINDSYGGVSQLTPGEYEEAVPSKPHP